MLKIVVIFALIFASMAEKSNVLIVFANPEPKSFTYAMVDTCVKTLEKEGHKVKTSDLYKLKMFNRIDKTDFTQLYDPSYFRPQKEQEVANQKNGTTFVEEIRRERDLHIWANIIIFLYPVYLGYMPGILQSYVERVQSYGFAHGPHNFEGKKAMTIYSTASPKEYAVKVEETMEKMRAACSANRKMKTIPKYAAYAVTNVDEPTRKKYLEELAQRMVDIDKTPTE